MSSWVDTAVSILIILVLALIAYSKYQQQTMVDTMREIKELLQELKPQSTPEWEYE